MLYMILNDNNNGLRRFLYFDNLVVMTEKGLQIRSIKTIH